MINSEMNTQTYSQLAGRQGNAGVLRQMPQHSGHVPPPLNRNEVEQAPLPVSEYFANKLLIILAFLLTASVLLYMIAALFGDEISRGGHSASPEKLEIIVGNEVLYLPSNLIRYSSQRRAGLHHRVELYVHWPSLSGYTDALSAEFNKSSEESNLIFVTLEKRSMAYDMSGRISSIYKRFFVGDPVPFKAGLVKQALAPEGGFIDEDLYYAAGSPYPFATRCVKDNSSAGTPYCLRDIHITENLSLTYRFHKRKLGDWISIDRKLREMVKVMIIKPVNG